MLFRYRCLFSFLFIITAIFLFACSDENAQQQQQRKKDPPPVVDVIIAKTKTISNILEANGTVIASESVELHPEATGRLIYLNIPEGSFVKRGTVLARVNDADLRAQLNKSKAQLELYQ